MARQLARSRVLVFVLLLLVGCSPTELNNASTGDHTRLPVCTPDSEASVHLSNSQLDQMDTTVFAEEKSIFANPERGWYRAYETDDLWDIDGLRDQGITMVLLKANLRDFTNQPISGAKLKEIQSAFDRARANGLQVMFRAAYDFDGELNREPKRLSTITGHIGQLKELFYQNEDILYCVQAGFLGPWGEWHSSLYGNPPSLASRKAVLLALMEAVPKSRAILVRRPMFIRELFQGEPGGSALTEATAFRGTNLARTGYHDDALLSTNSESGTYVDPAFSRRDELDWVDNQNKYVPFVAESNQLTPLSDPDNAMYELNKLHAQLLDGVFHPEVIAKWKTGTFAGISTYDYISQHLGYRLILLDASVNTSVRKGGALHLKVRLRNDGFGNLINARPVEVVLSNGQDTYVANVDEDPRRWYRENGTMVKDWYFSVPAQIESGAWNISLNLPSAYPSLGNNPLYSIRFANSGVWQPETGTNLIKRGLFIADGETGNSVDSFQEISREAAEGLVAG